MLCLIQFFHSLLSMMEWTGYWLLAQWSGTSTTDIDLKWDTKADSSDAKHKQTIGQ